MNLYYRKAAYGLIIAACGVYIACVNLREVGQHLAYVEKRRAKLVDQLDHAEARLSQYEPVDRYRRDPAPLVDVEAVRAYADERQADEADKPADPLVFGPAE